MHVVVSGAAGALARALLPRVLAEPGIGRVTGIDLRPVAFEHPRFVPLQADIGEAAALDRLREADALVHLAFTLLRGRLPAQEMERRNVATTLRLFEAAAAAGAHVIFVSSAAVYGAGESLREDAALRPLPGFLYAAHKLACERWLASQLPGAAVLRPHAILGPNALPLLKRLASLPAYPRLPDPQALLQCVHEDDVAAAILAALRLRAAGTFNLAAPRPFCLRQLIRASHPRAVPLPLPLARAALGFAWGVAGWGGEPGWFAGVEHTLTLDCGRAASELGWQPHHREWRPILAATLAA